MTENRLKSLLEPAAEQAGVRFVDLLLRGQRGSTVLEVFVDTVDGVSADDLARVSRCLEEILEAEDLLKGAYTLIVSSPGLDRPIRFPWQYTRHVGRTVEATVAVSEADADDGERLVTGIIEANDDTALTISQGGEREIIAHENIREARIVASLRD